MFGVYFVVANPTFGLNNHNMTRIELNTNRIVKFLLIFISDRITLAFLRWIHEHTEELLFTRNNNRSCLWDNCVTTKKIPVDLALPKKLSVLDT
jgi:hypothetical protein